MEVRNLRLPVRLCFGMEEVWQHSALGVPHLKTTFKLNTIEQVAYCYKTGGFTQQVSGLALLTKNKLIWKQNNNVQIYSMVKLQYPFQT